MQCAGCGITQILRSPHDDKVAWSQNKAGGGQLPASRQSSFRAALDDPVQRPGPTQHRAYAALLGPLASKVLSAAFSLPMFTLICFGLASAFLGRATFNTPLS